MNIIWKVHVNIKKKKHFYCLSFVQCIIMYNVDGKLHYQLCYSYDCCNGIMLSARDMKSRNNHQKTIEY